MKKLFATIIVASTAAVGFAATPLWMRDVKISPDGSQIAFCYKGDIQSCLCWRLCRAANIARLIRVGACMVARRKADCFCQRPIRKQRCVYYECRRWFGSASDHKVGR